jgi:hypothetical protein
MRLVKSLCCAVALAVCLVPAARADEWNKKTFLTFSGPVQIPGATLAAGTYVFKLADLSGSRHVVQVFDKDEKHVYATILAIPDQRLEPADDPVVLFAERPAGTPQAIRAWFYPGDTIGDEFVYPKTQAVKIAKANHNSVLATEDSTNTSASDNERMESMRSAKVGRVDENGSAVADNNNNNNNNRPRATGTTASTETPAAQQNRPASSATSTTTSDDARLKNSSRERSNTAARATGTSGQTAANNNNNKNNTRRRRLPQTASNLALMELLGAVSLAGAFAARRLRTRLVDVR